MKTLSLVGNSQVPVDPAPKADGRLLKHLGCLGPLPLVRTSGERGWRSHPRLLVTLKRRQRKAFGGRSKSPSTARWEESSYWPLVSRRPPIWVSRSVSINWATMRIYLGFTRLAGPPSPLFCRLPLGWPFVLLTGTKDLPAWPGARQDPLVDLVTRLQTAFPGQGGQFF